DICLYTFDRPGMGLSDFQVGRTLLDWADDMRDFATQKAINRFAMMGVSGGAPYVAACACAISDLLSSATLVSGVSPMSPQMLQTLSFPTRMITFLARRMVGLLTLQNNLLGFFVKHGDGETLLRRSLGMLPASDQQIIAQPDVAQILVTDVLESIRQGGKGSAMDMHVFTAKDWGFKLEDIKTKVFIWQGEDDPQATPAMAKYMSERIPNNEVTFVPNAGHFLILGHWREILKQLLAHWGNDEM
ncbi:MAG: alpha/beta hydrolase, partial [Anaerolineae bacterium]|nr:alpha/beta hydrolase [Anaerolineae bacterium]